MAYNPILAEAGSYRCPRPKIIAEVENKWSIEKVAKWFEKE
jgi:hypothetical protein